ncbi:MAG TPA: response regulator [Myxococcota bacterium]|nr:response regulator [Myxococcota bacterium]
MSPTILVVDDDRSLCQILTKTFQLEGWNVVTAHDGDDALAKARSRAPDLLLLDLLLPKRDGFAVLEAIRSEAPPLAETPAIFLTGCSRTKQYEERAERLRAAAFLTKPVALDTLREVTAKAVSVSGGKAGAAPVAARPAAVAPAGAAAARTLAGDLREISFPALLHHLHGLRATGVLQLQSGKKRKAVQFRDGYPAAVKSNLVSECLGNMLRRGDKITAEELDESLRRVKSGEGLQGEILVAMALLSESELVDALREQSEEKLFELFEWRSGPFRFELGAKLEGANALSLEGGPANLILDGVRRRFPLDVIDAHLATLADRYLAPNESPFHRFQDIDLDPGEDFLLRALDGRVKLRDLGEQGEATRRTLYGLIITGLLEARGRVEVTEPAAAGAGEPAKAAPARMPAAVPNPPRSIDPADVALRAELTALAERMRGKGYFEVLGIPEKATDEDVRRSYVELAKKTHPDRFSGASEPVRKLAEEVFGLVSKAYETLGDVRRRTQYLLDRKGSKQAAADLEEGQRALAAEIQFQNGEAKLRKRDFEGAIQDFEWAVRLFPEEGEYVAYLGWALYLSNPNDAETLKKAITIVKKGSKLAEDRDKPYLFLGRMYQAAGKLDAAERMLTTALEIRSDNVEALRELRLIHMRREKEKGLIGRLFRR